MTNLYNKAQESIKRKEYAQAIAYFDQLIQLDPKNADAYSERGVSKFHLNDLKGALYDMNKSLELEPENAYRYASRAYILEKCGDTLAAIEDYKKALELDPENAITHNNLGMLEEKLGYAQKAQKRYKLADTLSQKQGIHFEEEKVSNPEDLVESLLAELNIEVNEIPEKKETIFGIILSFFKSSEYRKDYIRFLKSMFKKNK